MRLHFTSENRPRHAVWALRRRTELDQEISKHVVAVLAGYEDWSDLEVNYDGGDASPMDGEIGAAEAATLARELSETLADLLAACDILDAPVGDMIAEMGLTCGREPGTLIDIDDEFLAEDDPKALHAGHAGLSCRF